MITKNANSKNSKFENHDEKKDIQKATKEFHKFLQDQGFTIQKIRMDGNCLFRSVAHQYTGNDENYATYRALAVAQLESNEQLYKDFVDIDFDGGFKSYVKRMANPGVWGGHLELLALSRVLSVKFCLITDTQEKIWVSMNANEDTQILYLAYHRRRSHYFSITKSREETLRLTPSEDEIEEIEVKEGKKKKVIKNTKEFNSQKETEISTSKILKSTTNKKAENKMEIEVPIDERKIVKVKTKSRNSISQIHAKKKINFKDIFLLENKELVYWCVENGILRKPTYCHSCRNRTGKINEVRLSNSKNYLDKVIWRCHNKNCGGIINIRKNNRLLEKFSKIKLRLLLIFIFTHFTVFFPPSASCVTLGIKTETMRNLYQTLNSWIVQEQINDELTRGKFGGEDKIVEMDESCFRGRKNNKGRLLNQIWAFGFVERGSGRLYAQYVSKRDRTNLIPIILKWIKPTSIMVVTDEWKPYKVLSKLGYNHKSVKHKDNFVCQDNPLIHTQTIENRWGIMKGKMKKRGRFSRELFSLQLKEIIWRILNKDLIQEKLLEIIKKNVY